MPDAKTFDAMKGGVPVDMTSAIGLFAHPMAATADASALGIGIASQAFGFWLGTVSAMTEASHRVFASWLDEVSGTGRQASAGRRSPASRARSATKVLIEEARSTARAASLAGKQGGGKQKP